MATTQPLTIMDVPSGQEQEFWQANYWDAVSSRDRTMDGVFFYAVLTTGV